MKLSTAFLVSALGFFAVSSTLRSHAVELHHLSTIKLGAFDEGAAEMIAYDAETKRLFAVNNEAGSVSVIDCSDPTNLKLVSTLDIGEHGKAPTCVETNGTLVAVTVVAEDKQAPGKVVFFDTSGEFVGVADTGALPDNVVFSPNGKLCVIANEGEPSDDYETDPEGSVTIVDVSSGEPGQVTQVGFGDLEVGQDVRIFGPGATPAQDLEPEFVAVSPDSATAWVVCQENNAVVTVDLATGKTTGIRGLGMKDHSREGNGFDASNKSEGVDIRPRPTFGLFQPDATLAHEIGGKTYLFTANEGDAREYIVEEDNGDETISYTDEERVEDMKLDPEAFPNAEALQKEDNLGRLKVTNATGDTDGDGDMDEIHSLGARSFSIWTTDWTMVYDSGSEFELITAEHLGKGFNSTNDEHPSFKDRSDDKGPEPEALAIGEIDGKTYAFIGLERSGGIMVYDVTRPAEAQYAGYTNRRNFEADVESEEAGDLGPEDIEFIPAADSPNGKNLVAVANEVSGTVSLFEAVVK